MAQPVERVTMLEQTIMKKIMLAVSAAGARVFRNNVAQAWTGDRPPYGPGAMVRLEQGDVLLRNARPLHAGLTKGSSDLIGWMPVTVTEEMVGRKLSVFAAIEVKGPKGRTSEQQADFIKAVQKAGGIAGVARSEAEAIALLEAGK
jgi:hypothetical protein